MKKFGVLLLVLVMVFALCGCKSSDYKEAKNLYDNGDYVSARNIFEELNGYKDSEEMIVNCKVERCIEILDEISTSEYLSELKYEEADETYKGLSLADKSRVTNAHVLEEYRVKYEQIMAEDEIKEEVIDYGKDWIKMLLNAPSTYKDHPSKKNYCSLQWDENNPELVSGWVDVYYVAENAFGGTIEGGYEWEWAATYKNGKLDITLFQSFGHMQDFLGGL